MDSFISIQIGATYNHVKATLTFLGVIARLVCGEGQRCMLGFKPEMGRSRHEDGYPQGQHRALSGGPWGPLGWDASHLAETLVVKAAHSLAYVSLVVPVISSHWAWSVPPATEAEMGWGAVFRTWPQSLPKD